MREKLQTLSLVQLKEIAKEQGFKGVSNLNKANIIELLVEFSENRSKEVSNSEGGSPEMTGKDNSYQRDGYSGQNYSGQSIQVKPEVHITVHKEALQIKAEIADIIIHIKTDKGIVK